MSGRERNIDPGAVDRPHVVAARPINPLDGFPFVVGQIVRRADENVGAIARSRLNRLPNRCAR